jgi:HAD superfamily hydrolase (TIGR01549 family)
MTIHNTPNPVPSAIKAILFDFHNTLVTCDRWLDLEIHTLPAQVLERLAVKGYLPGNSTVPPEQTQEAIDLFHLLRQQARESGVEVSALEGAQDVLTRMGYTPTIEVIEEIVADLERDCLLEAAPVEGALDTLQRLRDAGYTMGVVSSAGWPPFVEMALEAQGMRPFFAEILTSAGEGIYKSDPDIFRRAVSRLGFAPGEAVHVGDHARYDVQSAHAAGLRTVWFAVHARRTALLHNADWEALARDGAQADAIIYALPELLQVVSRWS